MKCTKAAVAIVGAALCGCLALLLFFALTDSVEGNGAASPRSAGDAFRPEDPGGAVRRRKLIEEGPASRSPRPAAVALEQGEAPPDEADEQLTEEEKRKAAAEARWDKAIERCEALQDVEKNPSMGDVAEFKAAFDALDADDKLQQIARANILLLDSSVECLVAILLDANEPEDVLSSVFHDICNRDESIKLPIFKAIAKLKSHPMAADAQEILSVYE